MTIVTQLMVLLPLSVSLIRSVVAIDQPPRLMRSKAARKEVVIGASGQQTSDRVSLMGNKRVKANVEVHARGNQASTGMDLTVQPSGSASLMRNKRKSTSAKMIRDSAVLEAGKDKATLSPNHWRQQFQGCFEHFAKRPFEIDQGRMGRDALTVDRCRDRCEAYAYMAINDGDQCFCTNAYDTESQSALQASQCSGINPQCAIANGCGGAQTDSIYVVKKACSAPFMPCSAWGDPHYTKTFYRARFDFMGLGLYNLASSVDGSFVLQGFQCPWRSRRASVFAGFAMKVGGSNVSIIGPTVTVDGATFTGTSDALGLNVRGKTVKLDSPNNCVHFQSTFHTHRHGGYYHNLNANIAGAPSADDSFGAMDGICGSEDGRQPVQRAESIFSGADLDHLCQKCGASEICSSTSLLEMSEADDQPYANASEACAAAGISLEDAQAKCGTLQGDTTFVEACMYDFCASDGDEAIVTNANAAKQLEDERSTTFPETAAPTLAPTAAPTTTHSPTTADIQWITGGTDTACRIDASDTTVDGRGTTCSGACKPGECPCVASLDACKASCAAQASCTGIEFRASNGRCEIWTQQIGFMASAGGFECIRKVTEPLTPTQTTSASPTGPPASSPTTPPTAQCTSFADPCRASCDCWRKDADGTTCGDRITESGDAEAVLKDFPSICGCTCIVFRSAAASMPARFLQFLFLPVLLAVSATV